MKREVITTAEALADLPVGAVVLDNGGKWGTDKSAWTKSDDTERMDDGLQLPTAWGSIVWAMDRTDEELAEEFGPLLLLWDPREDAK